MRKAMLLKNIERLQIRIHESYTEGTVRPMTPVLLNLERVRRELAEIEEQEDFEKVLSGDGCEKAAIVLELCS